VALADRGSGVEFADLVGAAAGAGDHVLDPLHRRLGQDRPDEVQLAGACLPEAEVELTDDNPPGVGGDGLVTSDSVMIIGWGSHRRRAQVSVQRADEVRRSTFLTRRWRREWPRRAVAGGPR
jgi:hypothetical protein